MTDAKQIEDLLDLLDGRGSETEWAAVKRLKELLHDALPTYLLSAYRNARSWRSRSSFVFHAIPYARKHDDAVNLGMLAIFDRSKVVRYRACMLLAISQKSSALASLREAERAFMGTNSSDMSAAIDAIEHKNQDYFLDRAHTGNVKLSVNLL